MSIGKLRTIACSGDWSGSDGWRAAGKGVTKEIWSCDWELEEDEDPWRGGKGPAVAERLAGGVGDSDRFEGTRTEAIDRGANERM